MYIRQDKLSALKEYKYSGVDHSLLSRYVLKPFYVNVALPCFPMSMAPNAITLTGFGFVVINFFTLLYYNPTLDQDCPPWVYASWAIGLFLYQTFDAVDGQQARRTGQSGPLGESFDHGVDALNTFLEVLLFAGATCMGQSWATVLTLAACLVTFYVQTWDEYHTHTLTLGIISGPVEGILTLCIMYAATAFIGSGHFWQRPMLECIGVPKSAAIPAIIYNATWAETWMVYGGVVLVLNTWQSAQSSMEARRARGQRGRQALLGLIPLVSTWVLVGAYLALNQTILHKHLIPFTFFVGLLNAYSVGQMIIAHVTKARFPYQNILLLPLAWAVVDSAGPWLTEKVGWGWPSALGEEYQVAFVFLCLGLSVGVYGSFVLDAIFTICDYLDIWCLTIKHPQTQGQPGKPVTRSSKKHN